MLLRLGCQTSDCVTMVNAALTIIMLFLHSPRCLSGHWGYTSSFLTNTNLYYIDTDEIPGFLILLKNHIFTAKIL